MTVQFCKQSLKFATAVAAIALFGCSSGGGSGGGSSTGTTFSLSGTMSGLSVVFPNATAPKISGWDYLKNQAIALHNEIASIPGNDVHALAACNDGFFYRVLCSAWSTPPVSAYGDVNCGTSGSSGGFTVSGLPLDTDITCAVRRGSDGASFSPFATLELPSTSLSGSTDNINTGGNIVVSVTVDNTTGTITAAVTSGTNDTGSSTPTVDPTTYTGFYNITCPSTMGAANQLACKCMILNDSGGNNETCIATNGASITFASQMTVNLGVYQATVGGSGADTDGDAVVDMPANATVYGGTIWGAANGGSSCTSAGACDSARSTGGEKFPTFGGDLTWSSATATNDIAWATSLSNMSCGAGSDATVTVPAVPSSSGTRNDWLTWLETLVDNYVTACKAANGTTEPSYQGCDISVVNKHLDSNCLGNFGWQRLEQAEGNVPKYRWRWDNWTCGTSGCTPPALTSAAMSIEGVDFNGSSLTTAPTFYSPSPSKRFMMDQWIPIAGGNGGSLKQREEDNRSFNCDDTLSTPCPSGHDHAWIECGTSRTMIVKFIPTSTTGIFNMVFSPSNEVRYGRYRGGPMGIDGTNAYDICVDNLNATATPEFMATGTKL